MNADSIACSDRNRRLRSFALGDCQRAESIGTAGADGTFASVCQVNSDQINRKYGEHTLLAVTNGSVQASLTLTFIPPEVFH